VRLIKIILFYDKPRAIGKKKDLDNISSFKEFFVEKLGK